MTTTMETPAATVLRVVLAVHGAQTFSALTAAALALRTNAPKYQTKSLAATHAVTVCIVERRAKIAGVIASILIVIVPATKTTNGLTGALTVVLRLTAANADSAMKAAACVLMDTVEPIALCHQAKGCGVPTG